MTLLRVDKTANSTDPLFEWLSVGTREVLSEKMFKRMLAVERNRTERSREPFLLMLLEAGKHQTSERAGRALDNILSVLPLSIRETDVIGWYKDRTIAGVIFTGIESSDKNSILSVILSKVSTALRDRLTPDQFNQVSISFHFFPDDWDQDNSGCPSNTSLYPDLLTHDRDKSSLLRIKQVMDIVGSTLLLILCSPLFLIIALAIKMSSKGPVLFRQQRVGRYGQCFTFLKFRSLHAHNDSRDHKEYMAKLMAGEGAHKHVNGNGQGL